MQHKATVSPIRVHYLDHDQRVTISRVVGYHAACSCDWKGPNRKDWPAARLDRIEHLRTLAGVEGSSDSERAYLG